MHTQKISGFTNWPHPVKRFQCQKENLVDCTKLRVKCALGKNAQDYNRFPADLQEEILIKD